MSTWIPCKEASPGWIVDAVMEVVGVVTVPNLFEALDGEGVDVVVAVMGLSFRRGLFAGDVQPVWARAINSDWKKIPGESKNCAFGSGGNQNLTRPIFWII